MTGQKAPYDEKRSRSKTQIEQVKKRGGLIAGVCGAIIAMSSIRWLVASQTVQNLQYVVTLSSLGMVCQCPANAGGKMICKHVFAVHKFLEKEWWTRARSRIRIRRQNIRCMNKSCPSEKIVKNGRRRCKRKEPVQRYLCVSCGCTFSGIAGFRGRHFEAPTIIRSLSMVAAKMSPTEVCRQMRLEGISIHPTTIAKWVNNYSNIMYGYSTTLRVDAGYQWHVDELYFTVLGKARYLFAVMDGASRFILAYEISSVKQGVKPAGLFAAAAARAVRLPRILVSDGLQEFCKAANKVFYRAAGPRFVHIREIHLHNMLNQNNVYERLNGEFRDRLQCTRGLKSNDSAVIRLFMVYHNFFREHTSLENEITPAEVIGIDIVPVQGSNLTHDCNRWITFIQNAALSTVV